MIQHPKTKTAASVQELGDICFCVKLRSLNQKTGDHILDWAASTYTSFRFVNFHPIACLALHDWSLSEYVVVCHGSGTVMLPTHAKAQFKMKNFEIRTTIKMKVCCILKLTIQKQNQEESVMDSREDSLLSSEERDQSTQFRQMQKNQLIQLL